MKRANIIASVLVILGTITTVFGQQQTENKADQTLRGSGRVNASTLGMEFDMPLGGYSGRGINVPINLSYSSKLWRFESFASFPGVNNPDICLAPTKTFFAENTASGWTTSLATPYIEYTNNRYDQNGLPLGDTCDPNAPGNQYVGYMRRLTIHLPGGETHELRVNDTAIVNLSSSGIPEDYNGTYYAVDSSNLRYIEDSATNTYKLLMPDGSLYEFGATTSVLSSSTIRKATKFSDRNGNYTTYNAPTETYPNGYWTDTMGRTISVPFGLKATTAPNVQTYNMPGLGGNTSVTYKFYWKKLKDTTAAESALNDFNQELRYAADYSGSNGTQRTGTDCCLFNSQQGSARIFDAAGSEKFNPVVLAEIELPTGQKYKFGYNIYGEIENVKYPTGGEEKFVYGQVSSVSELEYPHDKANRGVTNRKVYQTAGGSSFYQWTYSTTGAPAPNYGLEIATTNPDNTQTVRRVYRSYVAGYTNWGYDNILSGMPYEEIAKNSAGQVVSRKLTNWTKGLGSGSTLEWHPRVTSEESYIYDTSGNGVYALTAFEYEGDLSQRETPVMTKKSSQYAFAVAGSSPPSTPIRTSETTFLINDANISQTIRDVYKAKNMIGLATASVVKDSAGTIVSRSEMAYDEAGYSIISAATTAANWQDPNSSYRGNPTTAKVWDSTKGASTSSGAYIATHAQFDNFGNQRKVWDAKGNLTETDYTSPSGQDYKFAFPTKVTSAVPDPTNTNGSNTAFEMTATFDVTTGLPKTTTDANGLETRITYDATTLRPSNVKTYYPTETQVGGTVETVYHDELNNYWVKSRQQTDTNVWAESISYFDGLGRAYKAEEVNSQGNIFVEKEFDAQGRVSRVTNPFRSGETKIWTTNTYDESSRVKEVTLPDGAKVKTDYGVSIASGFIGVTKTITDQANKKRKGISDALGRMIRVIEDPTGQNLNTDYVFDTLGNLRKTTQGDQSRYFTHDSLGRLLYAKQPEQQARTAFSYTDSITGNTSWSVKYEYDDNGNITSTTNAEGVSVTGTYDNFNRLKLRNYSDSTPDVDFFYDGRGLGSIPNFSKGKTTKVTSSVSETRYTSFDNQGRLLTSEQRTPFDDTETIATATPRVSSYEYDAFGKLLTETYPSGRTVKTDYNQDGDVSSIWGTVGTQNRLYANGISYNSAGAIERLRLGNGKWETTAYNNRLQVTEIGLGSSATDKSFLKLEYDYGTNMENNGSLRSQKISFSGLSQPFEQTYIYDDLNRLQSAEEKVSTTTTWKQTFTYDRYGNRRFDAANTTTLTASNNITNPTIDTATNRFSSGQNYSYDKDGNLTVDANGNQFLYDAENHQKEVKNSSNQTIGLYVYDGEGKRVKKISSTETVIFVYDGGGQLVAEYSTKSAETPQVSYLTSDHLGSPRVITNQLGAVTTRKDYMAFGEETYTTQRTSTLNYDNESETRKGYTGYEKDDESGLDFAQARYYNSKHGRFTSVDPSADSASLKNPQTFNRYGYTLNSPYKFTDPLGLISKDAGSPCGQWCPNSGDVVDGSTFRGNDTTVNAIFNDMYINQNVQAAIVKISSGAWTSGGLITRAQEKTLGKALTHILEKGNKMARYIVSELVLGGIDFEFIPRAQIAEKASAQVRVTDVAGLNKAIQDDYGDGLSVTDSMQFMTMSIATEELTNSVSPIAALESNIVHEGSHGLDYGLVINSATLGGSYDLTSDQSELRAKTNAIEFEHDRGDYYVKHGKVIGFINKKGAVDYTAVGNASTGSTKPSLLTNLNNNGVKWR